MSVNINTLVLRKQQLHLLDPAFYDKSVSSPYLRLMDGNGREAPLLREVSHSYSGAEHCSLQQNVHDILAWL